MARTQTRIRPRSRTTADQAASGRIPPGCTCVRASRGAAAAGRRRLAADRRSAEARLPAPVRPRLQPARRDPLPDLCGADRAPIAIGLASRGDRIGDSDIKVQDLVEWLGWLDRFDPMCAAMIDLHYFAGLTPKQTRRRASACRRDRHPRPAVCQGLAADEALMRSGQLSRFPCSNRRPPPDGPQ